MNPLNFLIFLLLPYFLVLFVHSIEIHPFQPIISITITNRNEWPLNYDFDAFPCLMEWNMCVRHNGGPCLPYEGIRGFDEQGALLFPFEKYSCGVYIAEAFDMEQPGIYSVQFRGHYDKNEIEKEGVQEMDTMLSLEIVPAKLRNLHEDYYIYPYVSIGPSNTLYMEKLSRDRTPFGDLSRNLKCEVNETSLSYDGIMGSYDAVDTYLILLPGESKIVSFLLEENFDLSAAGHYNCWFGETTSSIALLEDYVNINITQSEPLPSYPSERPQNLTEYLNMLTSLPEKWVPRSQNFTFLKGEEGFQEPPPDPVLPFTRYQLAVMNKLDHQDEQGPIGRRLKKAIQSLKTPNTLPYKRWFEGYGTIFFNDVKTTFNKMYDLVEKGVVIIEMSDWSDYKKCNESSTKAWTFAKHWPNRIFVCPRFFDDDHPFDGAVWRKNEILDLGLVNTLIHELAHLAGVHSDEIGEKKKYSECLELARVEPRNAIKNAKNYGYFVNNVTYTVSLRSVSGDGLRTDKSATLYSDNTASSLTFNCIGEFPICKLQETSSGKFVHPDDGWFNDDLELRASTDKLWYFEALENGVYHWYYLLKPYPYEINRRKVTVDSNGKLTDESRATPSLASHWFLTLDDTWGTIPVFTLADTIGTQLPFRYDPGDGEVYCKYNPDTNYMAFTPIGSPGNTYLRVISDTSTDKYLDYRFGTDLVKVSTSPSLWNLTKNRFIDKTCTLNNIKKWGSRDNVYCSTSTLNPGFVYTDGNQPRSLLREFMHFLDPSRPFVLEESFNHSSLPTEIKESFAHNSLPSEIEDKEIEITSSKAFLLIN